MWNAIDLKGKRFSRLLVKEKSPLKKQGQLTWNCICDCGNEISNVAGHGLRSGSTRSCGCLLRDITIERCKTHGETQSAIRTPEYRAWQGMMERCYKPSNASYLNYGGRGIGVCERWRGSYENFLIDMGRRPSSKHSIDRYPNNDGNYEPSNCRWATWEQQARNKRSNKMVEFGDKILTLVEVSLIVGVPAGTISRRLDKGWAYYDVWRPVGLKRYVRP